MYEERPSRVEGAVLWTSTSSDVDGRVLPDGCMDIMLLGDDLVVAGPDTVAFVSPARPGAAYIGLRFAPGTGPSAIGVAAHELRDQRVPLEAVWSSADVRRLRDDMGATGDAAGSLERAAIRRLRDAAPDPIVPTVVRALRAGRDVVAAAAACGLSDRQLRRRSLDVFGYGPKMLARIFRMTRALELTRSGTPMAATAAEAGYADQAHMAREVKSLTGVPLTALLD